MKRMLMASLLVLAMMAGCTSGTSEKNNTIVEDKQETSQETVQAESDAAEVTLPAESDHGYGRYVIYEEEGRTQIHITSQEELDGLYNSLLAGESYNNCDIRISAGKYEIPDYLLFVNCTDVRVIGEEETEIVSNDSEANVVIVQNCEDMVFANLILGHKEGGHSCEGAVVRLNDSEGTQLVNCDLYGCGTEGVNMDGGTAEMHGVTIRDCSDDIMSVSRGTLNADDCFFTGNGYDEYIYEIYPGYSGLNGEINVTNSDVKNNRNTVQSSDYVTLNYANVIETGNGWN